MLIRNSSLFDKSARECFLCWFDSVLTRFLVLFANSLQQSNNFLPQKKRVMNCLLFSLKLSGDDDTWYFDFVLYLARESLRAIVGAHGTTERKKINKQTEPHTKALIQRTRNVLFNIYTFIIPSRWFSLFCKLLFVVAGGWCARGRWTGHFTVIGFMTWLRQKKRRWICTHRPRADKHVQLQLKSTNCGKQLELTSNLSFNVVDVWMPFQRHKNKSLSTEVSQPFVCAENTKSTKTIVNFWELFFLYAAAECNWHLCAPCDKPVNERGCWAKVLR